MVFILFLPVPLAVLRLGHGLRRQGNRITGRLDRRLLLLTVSMAAVSSAVMALLAGVLVLRLSAMEATRDGLTLQRQISVGLTSYQTLPELQRRLQLTTSAGEADQILVLDQGQRVLAASDATLLGLSLAQLLQQPPVARVMGALVRRCRPLAPAVCLHQDQEIFLGPLPYFGGDALVQLREFPLALEGTGRYGHRATLLTIMDLEAYRSHLLSLVWSTFLVGLGPLMLSTGGLLWLVRHQVLPDLLGQAHTDELSGVYNRRAFWELATETLDLAEQGHWPLALALIDIDHFKGVNDTYGHAGGDAVIRHVSMVLHGAVRRGSDLVGRVGGDEFVLLLRSNVEEASHLLDRCRQNLELHPLLLGDGREVAIHLSVGVASTQGPAGYGLRGLMAAADAALYVAKGQGRGQVVNLEALDGCGDGWRRRGG